MNQSDLCEGESQNPKALTSASHLQFINLRQDFELLNRSAQLFLYRVEIADQVFQADAQAPEIQVWVDLHPACIGAALSALSPACTGLNLEVNFGRKKASLGKARGG